MCRRRPTRARRIPSVRRLRGVVEAPERVQKYHNQTCPRRAARRRRARREEAVTAGGAAVQPGLHQLEAIHEGSARLRCMLCQHTWTSGNVRSVCSAFPAERFVTWTELRRRHSTTSRAVPHEAVRVIKAPYDRYLDDLQRAAPIVISPARQPEFAFCWRNLSACLARPLRFLLSTPGT